MFVTSLVISAIEPASSECFRLVGGVLVGQTVGEVLPTVEMGYVVAEY